MTEATQDPTSRRFIIIGGGPAGLTAAYELTRYSHTPTVFEKLDRVGGIARTENYKGYYFDMGGHRFFTKSEEVNNFWHEVLQDEFLKRPRLSRIFYNQKFFNYPLKPMNALMGLGLGQGALIILSYLRWQLFPYKEEETFEQWVTNRFGKRLFETFFKSYTEKVWGISTSELKAEWAAQRIKDLSLKSAILNMFIKDGNTIKTLIEEFHYPRLGPGMLWNKVRCDVEERGGQVHLNTPVTRINRNGSKIESVVVSGPDGEQTVEGTDFISTMPIPVFLRSLNPPPPDEIIAAADQLKFRDFLTVCLIVNKKELFPDNWIYVHDPKVQVGRIQNFKNWSPYMVPDPDTTSLGLEYFCNQGDELWTMDDDDLVELGKREVDQINLANYDDISDGCVYRVENTYPVYDSDYRSHLDTVRGYLDGLENFQTIGRNGLHRYNNQDHAMLTGMHAVRNTLLGEQTDLWVINAEQEYHEEVREREVESAVREALAQAFMKLDAGAFGIAVGSATGLILFLLTFITAVFQGPQGGFADKLWLLSQYFPGYGVSLTGSAFGLFYGFLVAFALAWWFAFMRNAVALLYMAFIHRRAELQLLRKLLDF